MIYKETLVQITFPHTCHRFLSICPTMVWKKLVSSVLSQETAVCCKSPSAESLRQVCEGSGLHTSLQTQKNDMYQSLMCHTCIYIRIKSTLECLLPYFLIYQQDVYVCRLSIPIMNYTYI